MLKSKAPLSTYRELTTSDVTSCHFVTSHQSDPREVSRQDGLSINRTYRPDPAVVDALVEALYSLIVEPPQTSVTGSSLGNMSLGKPACFPAAHE